MIESIEFSVRGQEHTNIYTREEYLLYLEMKRKEYVGIHRAQTWILDGKKIIPKFKGGTPSYNWDCVIFEKDSKTLVVCNPDGSVRFEVPIPDKLIQRGEYDNHFKLSEWKSKEIEKDYYVMKYERFDDYFQYNGKHYLSVLLGKYNENENFDAYLQMRYLDCDTGEFLPFTKKIIQRIPNPHSYTENRVEL
jgi:hypothetical protein